MQSEQTHKSNQPEPPVLPTGSTVSLLRKLCSTLEAQHKDLLTLITCCQRHLLDGLVVAHQGFLCHPLIHVVLEAIQGSALFLELVVQGARRDVQLQGILFSAVLMSVRQTDVNSAMEAKVRSWLQQTQFVQAQALAIIPQYRIHPLLS